MKHSQFARRAAVAVGLALGLAGAAAAAQLDGPATIVYDPFRVPTIVAQTEQVMKNLGALLRAAGVNFDHVVRTTVFLADMGDFAAMNEVYSRHVGTPAPARATVQVARLPRDVKIEVDAIAVLS